VILENAKPITNAISVEARERQIYVTPRVNPRANMVMGATNCITSLGAVIGIETRL
jgi:hypothetical protein